MRSGCRCRIEAPRGGQTLGSTPAAFADFLKTETVRLGEVVKNAGIKQE